MGKDSVRSSVSGVAGGSHDCVTRMELRMSVCGACVCVCVLPKYSRNMLIYLETACFDDMTVYI